MRIGSGFCFIVVNGESKMKQIGWGFLENCEVKLMKMKKNCVFILNCC